MLIKTSLAIVILLSSFSLACAEMYQWVDDKGVVTFKDTPPPALKKHAKVKTYSDSDFAPAPPYQPAPKARTDNSTKAASSPSSPKKVRFTGTVEMYITDWCGYCKKAQKYLTAKGIPYVTYDIEKDSAAERRHKELGGRGVPLIIIGSNKMSGFSPESLDYYLNNSK
jgi:glutaredoxin-like YruB-family protein